MRGLVRSIALMVLCGPVSGMAAQANVPTPESILGQSVGADFYLASYDESMEYFRALAAASPRVELREIGTTSLGKPWYIALISAPQNLDNVERHREIAHLLAQGDVTDAEARALAQEGRAIVHIDGGLHATEVAHAQHTIQLAYDLASETVDEEILAILDNVVLLLWPSINPDGQNMVVDWYRSNLGTPFEVAPTPFLYQKYIGHDNNRDGYMINMIESRVVTRVDRDWEPQILYNHHQTAPFPARIWIPPFAEPVSPYVHPLMWRTVNLLGMSMAQALEERGQRGAMHMGTGFDNWYPGFMDHANNFHNVAAFLTETGLYRYATPHFYTINDFPPSARDLRPESMYSSPWEGGWWRLRDAVDYMITASISVLDIAAKYREDILYNRYQAGRDVQAYHTDNPPYAFFIPQEQRDPVSAVEMLRRLAFNGIEVSQLDAAVEHEGQRHPAGTWVIPMDQPFANFVRQLFAVQHYPDLREFPDGPPDQPYDVSGWTLQYQMGVRVVEATEPLTDDIRSAMSAVSGDAVPWSSTEDASTFDTPPDAGFDSHPVAAGIVPPAGRLEGSGSAVLLDPGQNNAFRALNRAWSQGASVRLDNAGGQTRYAVTGLGSSAVSALVDDLHVQAQRGAANGVPLAQPRIGLYRPWQASMDEGWTRWLLEMYEFDFSNVYNAEMRAGNLSDKFDVIILADINPRSILQGHTPGTIPGRYAGGLGNEGVRALDAFVRGGGTLVAINNSTGFAIEQLHLPVKDVTSGIARDEFFMSGGLLEMEVDPTHPVMAGMPDRAPVFVFRSPVFATTEGFEGQALAKYAENGSPLLSGYLLGEEHLQGFASALDVHHGDGHVILLGMRPQWRGQPFGNFRILFNAALYSRNAAAGREPNTAFWTTPEEEKEGEGTSSNRR